ncbi:hypothetical protein V6N13_026418 [Hibiscus sabdariffa]|uniref:Uncharacterized protein n=1 Tax=Hibiscus sabdariffa TaxID=183260 RepID=A0ABR2P6A8_9ROSI
MEVSDGKIRNVVGSGNISGPREDRRRNGIEAGKHERATVGLGIFGIVGSRKVYAGESFERYEEKLSDAGSQPRQKPDLSVHPLFLRRN